MGAWGVKLYQDDVACDVKEEYIIKLRAGLSNDEVTESMIKEYELSDDEPIFWLALADIQWRYGRLLDKVKENAITYIDSGKDLEKWVDDLNLLDARKKC